MSERYIGTTWGKNNQIELNKHKMDKDRVAALAKISHFQERNGMKNT